MSLTTWKELISLKDNMNLTILNNFIGIEKCNKLKDIANNYKIENEKEFYFSNLHMKSSVKSWCSPYSTHQLTDNFREYEDLIVSHCENVVSKKLNIKDFWIAKYDEGNYALPHSHGTGNIEDILSGIYYINIEEDAAPIIFDEHDPITPENNMLILFDPDLMHRVPRTKGKRLLASFNLSTHK